ncbi:MAG: 16S rRNA (cytidine(1402)-2'-O)-methyltransferase [Thiohalomonadales bacterium]|nr:16S rRNA (cytidine(1402)-2'-O)-methyltransferase [Thiohalomonadales bacterium]
MILEKGALYVVATPIGNLGDMTQRAIEVLRDATLIAAEDTRHTRQLLQQFDITTECTALHEHNERKVTAGILMRLAQGDSIALVSDAGTPLLSDPGFHLVREAVAQGLTVIPVPGPSAVMTALSAGGLPTDRFCFEGFLPSKTTARCRRLEALQQVTSTLVFFEAPHRILATLQDMQTIFGAERKVVLARELTKRFETFLRGNLAELLHTVSADENQQKGEMVILVEGASTEAHSGINAETERVLKILLRQLSVKQAASLAAEITGVKKNLLYQFALQETSSD